MFRTKSEEQFYSLFITENKRPATKYEDKFLHFDMVINGVKIDVKGLKKVNRSDDQVNPDIHWVEVVNVRGNDGWLYGKADRIAFEIADGYLLINRLDLRKFCLEKVVDKKPSTEKGFYKLYRRSGTADASILVLTKDLMELPHIKILK